MPLLTTAATASIYHPGNPVLKKQPNQNMVVSPVNGNPIEHEPERRIAVLSQLSVSDKRSTFAEVREIVLRMFGNKDKDIPLIEEDKDEYTYKYAPKKIILFHPNNPSRLFTYITNCVDFIGVVGKTPSNGVDPYKIEFIAGIDMSFANLKEEEKSIYFKKILEHMAEVLNKELGSIDCDIKLKVQNRNGNKIIEVCGYIYVYSRKELPSIGMTMELSFHAGQLPAQQDNDKTVS